MATKKVVALATRVTSEEAAQIDGLPYGRRADNLRVLVRFALDHIEHVQPWLDANDGRPIEDEVVTVL